MSFSHDVEIKNRDGLVITGISSVNSFDDNQITMSLCSGEFLIIEGENLDIKEVNLQKGLVEASGTVISLIYEDSSSKLKKGLFKNLFERS